MIFQGDILHISLIFSEKGHNDSIQMMHLADVIQVNANCLNIR